MNRTAHAVLAELPRPLADDQPYFPLTPRALQRLWGRAVQAAGIPDLHLHDLRHVVGSHLLNKGVPDQMRAEVLGHSAGRQFAMTAGYSHATMEYLRRVYEELDDLVPQLWEKSRLTKGSPFSPSIMRTYPTRPVCRFLWRLVWLFDNLRAPGRDIAPILSTEGRTEAVIARNGV